MDDFTDECHEVNLTGPGWKHITERPEYCERKQHLEKCRKTGEAPCDCCPQCCTCG